MNQPLSGLRIVVTRAAHQAEDLARPLREKGADVILLPVIAIAPPLNPAYLARAIEQLPAYDWIIFTSGNAIRAVGPHSGAARVATVGAATRALAEKKGWRVSVTPEDYVAEGLIQALGQEDLRGKRILIPSAAVTRDVVRDELVRCGAIVDVVEAYRNVIPPEAAAQAARIFQAPFPDWITFASSSAVESLAKLVALDTLQKSKIASIGPVTSKTIHEHGLLVTAEANPHSIPGLVQAIAAKIA